MNYHELLMYHDISTINNLRVNLLSHDRAVPARLNRTIARLDVDYRGSTGYGRAYRMKLKSNWGIVDIEDVCAGAEYLVKKGGGSSWALPFLYISVLANFQHLYLGCWERPWDHCKIASSLFVCFAVKTKMTQIVRHYYCTYIKHDQMFHGYLADYQVVTVPARDDAQGSVFVTYREDDW